MCNRDFYNFIFNIEITKRMLSEITNIEIKIYSKRKIIL